MKIGLAVGFFDPQVGGSEEVVKRLAVGMRGMGHDVIVATSKDARRRPADMVCPVVEFDVRGRAATGITGDVAGYERFLRESDRDVWLFYAAQIWSTDVALPILGELPASTVVVPCGYSGLHDERMAEYFAKLPGHLAAADALVYMSENYQDYQHDRDAGLGHLATIVPNGADDHEFGRPPTHAEHDGRTVLCVSNHYRLKGHGNVVRAFRAAAGANDRLIIVGEVHGRNPRRSCWAACHLNALRDRRIRLVEHAARSDVVQSYFDADVFLFGSLVETAPLVIIEAMAAGLPFVSTPVGNVADFSDAGLVVAGTELGTALRSLLDDPATRRCLGDRGRARWSRDHRWSVVISRYERLFQELNAAAR